MLHVCEIKIDKKDDWGHCYQKDFMLPARVGSIKSVFANVIPSNRAIIELFKLTQNNTTEYYEPASVQLGTISASINNTKIVADNTPPFVTSLLKKSGVNNAKIKLSAPIKVERGSFVRLVIEERDKCLFVTDAATASIYRTLGKTNVQYPENGYTVKFYIEYE